MTNELEQQIYMKGYLDGANGFCPEPKKDILEDRNDELFDIYVQLKAFIYSECNELTNNQRQMLSSIISDFGYILQTLDKFNVK